MTMANRRRNISPLRRAPGRAVSSLFERGCDLHSTALWWAVPASDHRHLRLQVCSLAPEQVPSCNLRCGRLELAWLPLVSAGLTPGGPAPTWQHAQEKAPGLTNPANAEG